MKLFKVTTNWIKDLYKSSNDYIKNDCEGDYVVLVHAFAWVASSMNKIAQDLSSEGYNVINLNYPSRKHSIEYLAENFIAKTVDKLCINKKKKIHFVTHSLGGIIVRKYIETNSPLNLGRVVMIAPPNQGSKIADFVKNNFLLKAYFGPVLQQLGVEKDSFINSDLNKSVKFELGVIAGDLCINPLISFIIKEPNDGLISVKCTKLKGIKDHVILHSTHLFIVFNQECIKQTSYFLRHGYFHHLSN